MPSETLTEREKQMLLLAACGLSAKESAELLGISHRTVETHFANILVKLASTSKVNAVVRALKQGLIALDEIEEEKE